MIEKNIKMCINIEIDGVYHKIKLQDFENPEKIASTFIKNKKLDDGLIESLADNIRNFLIRAKNRAVKKKNFETNIESDNEEINENMQNLSNLTKESDNYKNFAFDFSDFESLKPSKKKTDNIRNTDLLKNCGNKKKAKKNNLTNGKKSIFEKLYNKGKLKQQYLNEKSYELSKVDYKKRKNSIKQNKKISYKTNFNKTLKKKYETPNKVQNKNLVIINPSSNFSFSKIEKKKKNEPKKKLNYLNKKFYYNNIKIEEHKNNLRKEILEEQINNLKIQKKNSKSIQNLNKKFYYRGVERKKAKEKMLNEEKILKEREILSIKFSHKPKINKISKLLSKVN